METKSVNELKKHVKFCGKCQTARNYRMMCEPIRKYATQDYVDPKEQSLSPYVINRTIIDPLSESISETANETDYKLIQEKLSLLDLIDREIIELFYWEGKTHREIAPLIGFKRHFSVQYRLKKAHKLLGHSLLAVKNRNNFLKPISEKNEFPVKQKEVRS